MARRRPKPVVRPATPADVVAIRDLVAAAYTPYLARIGRPPAPMLADYDELLRKADVLVAEVDRSLVGVLVLRSATDHVLVENVAVSPTERGTGLGARLLTLAEEEAVRRGVGEVRLYTNEAMTENLEYYPRRGYAEASRGTHEGYRRVLFSKRVGS